MVCTKLDRRLLAEQDKRPDYTILLTRLEYGTTLSEFPIAIAYHTETVITIRCLPGLELHLPAHNRDYLKNRNGTSCGKSASQHHPKKKIDKPRSPSARRGAVPFISRSSPEGAIYSKLRIPVQREPGHA